MDTAALDHFSAAERTRALQALIAKDGVPPAAAGTDVNLHAHTFFSFNAYGYSPTHYAWLAKKRGLAAAGIVDFDVLDGRDEFRAAARLLGLRSCVGMETRVFVPEFGDKVINSPGEPGISYHMGVGFPRQQLAGKEQAFLASLKATAQQRNRELVARVNAHLGKAALDFERDVLPLAPAGNATERHICLAYARKARAAFPKDADLVAFWTEKLKTDAAALDLPEGPKLTNAIRSATMKRGGVGYVQPEGGAFPRMGDTNAFILACGAIPTFAWLDGTSDGEQDIGRLLDVAVSTGVAAVNVIPDRNFTPGKPDAKLAHLNHFLALARDRELPVIVGTEMNSPGQKFVDAFATAELAPWVPLFLRGAHIACAHQALQEAAGLGYLSPWAARAFVSAREKNDFFAEAGRRLAPGAEDRLARLRPESTPQEVLARLG